MAAQERDCRVRKRPYYGAVRHFLTEQPVPRYRSLVTGVGGRRAAEYEAGDNANALNYGKQYAYYPEATVVLLYQRLARLSAQTGKERSLKQQRGKRIHQSQHCGKSHAVCKLLDEPHRAARGDGLCAVGKLTVVVVHNVGEKLNNEARCFEGEVVAGMNFGGLNHHAGAAVGNCLAQGGVARLGGVKAAELGAFKARRRRRD